MENIVNVGIKQVLFKEGDVASKLYLIKSGEILCLKSSKDRLIPVFRAEADDIIGESAMVPELIYTYSAITLSPVELIEMTSYNFKRVLDVTPEWLMDLTTVMIGRIQSTANLIAENRVVHPSILNDDQYTNALEIEYKKLLNQ